MYVCNVCKRVNLCANAFLSWRQTRQKPLPQPHSQVVIILLVQEIRTICQPNNHSILLKQQNKEKVCQYVQQLQYSIVHSMSVTNGQTVRTTIAQHDKNCVSIHVLRMPILTIYLPINPYNFNEISTNFVTYFLKPIWCLVSYTYIVNKPRQF